MSKKDLSLSIVIPCYNEADAIGQCLAAVFRQHCPADEVIVVDNNSTDGTVGVVRELQSRYPALRLLHEPRQGVQFARNHGLNAATSDIIARIDADTRLRPEWIGAALDYYTLNTNANVGVASGTTRYYDLPFQGLAGFFADFLAQRMVHRITGEHGIHGDNMTIRQVAWQRIKEEVCMRRGIMEDQDIAYHAVRSGWKTGWITDSIADVSGRRLRMSPLRFWRYNRQWWMTFANHGMQAQALGLRLMVWIANVAQAFGWFVLLFHDPRSNRFRLSQIAEKQGERGIP